MIVHEEGGGVKELRIPGRKSRTLGAKEIIVHKIIHEARGSATIVFRNIVSCVEIIIRNFP